MRPTRLKTPRWRIYSPLPYCVCPRSGIAMNECSCADCGRYMVAERRAAISTDVDTSCATD